MNIPINALIYTAKGVPINSRIGITLMKGAMVKVNNSFVTLDGNYIVCNGDMEYSSDISNRKVASNWKLKKL